MAIDSHFWKKLGNTIQDRFYDFFSSPVLVLLLAFTVVSIGTSIRNSKSRTNHASSSIEHEEDRGGEGGAVGASATDNYFWGELGNTIQEGFYDFFRSPVSILLLASVVVSIGTTIRRNRPKKSLSSFIFEESGVLSDREKLEKVVKATRLALKRISRESDPLVWAGAQHRLGVQLMMLGGQENSTKKLEEALRAHRLALQEIDRKERPKDWAIIHTNIGVTLGSIGERESGPKRLEEAVQALRLALEETPRERSPQDWALIQANLGSALATLGEREGSTDLVKKAVEANRLALQQRTREREPLAWAGIQKNLGRALLTLGEWETGTERLEESIDAYKSALEVITANQPEYWTGIQGSLKRAMSLLEERSE